MQQLSQSISFTEAHNSFKLNDEMQLQHMTKRFLSQLSNEQRNMLRYEVTVTQPKANIIDAYEIADITIHDHYTGNLYEYSIWGDDDTFNYLDDNELGGTYIWVRNMEDSIEFDSLETGQLKDAIQDGSLESLSINDFFGKNDGQSIEQAIIAHHIKGESFEIKASNKDFLTNSVPHYIAHHDIGELAIKAKENVLSKKDILNFAKVLDNPKLEFKYCDLDYLEKPFTRIFNRDRVNQKPKEFAAFQSVFKKLNINTKKLRKLKGMELER